MGDMGDSILPLVPRYAGPAALGGSRLEARVGEVGAEGIVGYSNAPYSIVGVAVNSDAAPLCPACSVGEGS